MLPNIRTEASAYPPVESTGQRFAQADSAPMLAVIKGKLEAQRPRHLPQSLTGKAVSYALDLWDGLTMYVGNGEMEIDNNLVENAIRPSALGRTGYSSAPRAAAGRTP